MTNIPLLQHTKQPSRHRNLQVQGFLWFIVSIFLASCIPAPGGTNKSLSLDQIDPAKIVAQPLDCDELYESGVFDYREGSGYATYQEAWDNLPPSERPSGEPAFKVEEDESVTWVYLDNEKKVGVLTAVYAPWGLWVISSVESCVE